MKISEKRKSELYKAISDPIIGLRIKHCIDGSTEDLDKDLFELEKIIWKDVIKTLNING